MIAANTIQAVVSRLKQTFADGGTQALAWRLAQLEGLHRMLRERGDDLGNAVNATLGRSQFDTWLAEISFIQAEIDFIARELPRWLQPKKVRTPLASRPGLSTVVREPHGVVLVISPWNYPLQLSLSPLIGAVCAGNCVVLKPSEAAPAVADLLADLLPQYVDPHAVAVIQGGAEITQDLLHADIDYVHYTGSREVGCKVMAAAAAKPVPVTLELGGKCPCIIHESATLKRAVRRIVWAKFLNAGQTCVAPDYMLVPAALEQTVLEHLKDTLKEFYGADSAEKPACGRIINQKQFQRLAAMLSDGDLVAGGGWDEGQLYIEPTVLRNVRSDSPLLQDEIFGPILPVITYNRLEQALHWVNSRPEPLALYLFCSDHTIERTVILRTRSGGVCVNDAIMQLTNLHLPFGGVGQSGFGRYHGRASFDAFTYQRSVLSLHPWYDPPFRYPPYTRTRRKWLQLLSRFIAR